MHFFDLGEAWIPTVGRMITLTVVAFAFLINYRLFMITKDNQSPLPSFIAAVLSAFLWFSPLIGFWAMTVRPDVIALVFDLCAAYFVLKYPANTLKGIIFASVFCYLSWACKQVNIVMPVAIGLFLLYEKRYRAFIVLSTLLGLAYASTLLLANYNLLKTLFFVNTSVPFSQEVLVGNFISFIKKSFPALLLFVCLYAKVLFTKTLRDSVFKDEFSKLGFCGILVWALILLPFSAKVGSAENYHFIALFFLLLTIGGALKHIQIEYQKSMQASFALAGFFFCVSVAFAFSKGTLGSIQAQHQNNMALKQCLEKLPQPIFVVNHYGALPWMNPSAMSFVLAYNYWRDRNDNRPFEHNGIGGLIKQGYFNSLVIPKEFTTNFDGANLSHFHLHEQACLNYAVLTKKDDA